MSNLFTSVAFKTTAHFISLGILSVILLGSNIAFGQAGSKDAQKFQSSVEDTREDIEKARAEIDNTMGAYNGIVNAEVDDPEKAYKSLTKEISKSEKAWTTAGKSYDKMRKAGDKLFAGWQKEVDAFTNEQMKQISVGRLEDATAKNQQMMDKMTAAQAAYEPFMSSLKDQALFMGRDLSPAAIEALQPLAEELNTLAATLLASIDALLNTEVEIDQSAEPAASTEPAEAVDAAVPEETD
jgi:hypothetical protein